MNFPKISRNSLLFLIAALSGYSSISQVDIRGTVYDRSMRYPLAGVSVMGSSGVGTATDSSGHYAIRLPPGDSVYFSYLGKFTTRFPVKDIPYTPGFDMSLEVSVDSLPSVIVRPRYYRFDSLQNRIDYQKIFDYDKATGLENMRSNRRGGMGVGLDFDMFFSGRANRRMEAFQKRLVEEEQDKYVDHRFNKTLVRRVTGLQSPALDTFMRRYRPGYEFTKACVTDWEFYEYILDSGRFFAKVWQEQHPGPPEHPAQPLIPDQEHPAGDTTTGEMHTD